MMKILFINLPYYGHVVPTIGLVQELIRQGCDVTYLMPHDWKDCIAESGAAFYGYQNHKKLSEQIKNAYAAAEHIINKFDFVIYEQFFFLGKHLAEQYGKPVARVFTAPATNQALMQEFITAKGPLSIFRHKWIAKAFTKDVAKNIPLKTDNWLDEIVFNPPELNLVYTLREYQPYAEEFSGSQYKFLGPSVYDRRSEPFPFTKSSNPVVYISLGTVLKGPVSFFQTCLDAFRGEPVDAIISTGQIFPVKKLKDVPPNVHMYPSVPQLDVLMLADVFVTHGGMNSVSESLVSGTPMVVIPFTSDQPVNARCVEALGVGKRLNYPTINSNVLKTAVFSVLTDPDIKRNIETVQQRITSAPGNRGGAKFVIDYYQKFIQ